MSKLYRQGDVLVIPVAVIPGKTSPVPREGGRVVLAHGEVTGHHHSILDERVELVTTEEADELRMWLTVSETAMSQVPVYETRKTGRVITPDPYYDDEFGTITPDPYEETVAVQVGERRVSGVALTHQEHDTIMLPPGRYEVRRQREYAPEAPVWVQD